MRLTTGPVINSGDLPSAIHSSVRAPENGDSPAKILPMAELEKQTILSTITHLNGDKLMAARLLGLARPPFTEN